MNKADIVVVGAGAAGLMAAGRAAEMGANVLLVEHQSKPGRKLAITGKGRCNLTNVMPLPDFLNHFHPNGRFLRTSFSHFFAEDLMTLLQQNGVKTIVERGGRVFPESGKAQDVVKALVAWNLNAGVTILNQTAVTLLHEEGGKLEGVSVCPTSQQKNKTIKDNRKQEKIICPAMILATGGASYPATGSTGDGYRMAEKIGHHIVKPRPALVPLELAGNETKMLEGLLLKNISASLWIEGKKITSEFGELQFTGFGLSGPVILTLSHLVVDGLLENKKAEIVLDLKPALEHKKLDDRLQRELKNSSKKQFQSILKTLLPLQMIPFCLSRTNIAPEKTCNEITAKDRKKLRLWLKEISLPISGYRPFSEAIITAGGISLKEVNSKNLASKKMKGLFLAGEVLDIQADTGGFNLQAAFSTGRLAAESALEYLSKKA